MNIKYFLGVVVGVTVTLLILHIGIGMPLLPELLQLR